MEEKYQTNKDSVSWEADEFFFHPKSSTWYLQALLGTVIIAAIPWLLSGRDDYISSVIILVALLGLTVYAGRKPNKRHYELTSNRLSVDTQHFSLFDFSRYWVEHLPTHIQITLVGIKRTQMPVALYIKDKVLAEKVLAILQAKLPQTNPSSNPADWLTRKIKL